MAMEIPPMGVKFILAAVMFIITACSGLIPVKITKLLERCDGRKGEMWMSLLSCFSGGIFLATCFLDIMPHVNEYFERYEDHVGHHVSFPIPQFAMCCGFVLVYLLEAFSKMVLSGHANPTIHVHNHNAKVRKQSVNLRRFSLVMEETANYAVAAKQDDTTLLKSVMCAIVMSFHSVLEGFALGVQDSFSQIATLFLSLVLHKSVEAFSVGLQVAKGNQAKLKAVIITILVYSAMTPIGTALGTALHKSDIDPFKKDFTVMIFEALSAGTFLYVTFFEILCVEKLSAQDSLRQVAAISLGFIVIALLQLGLEHHHGHEDHEMHMMNSTLSL